MKVGPDLTVSALTAPATVVRGVAFTITDTTRNIGGGPAGATTTSYYLSVNSTLDASDVLLSGRAVSALAGVAEETGSVSVVIPASQATGNYYIIAKADNGSVVTELLETNNTRVKADQGRIRQDQGSGKETALRAAGVRLIVGAVLQRGQRVFGEDRVAAVAGVEAVGRVVRRLIQPRIAHQIHDQHLPRGERVDAIGNADRNALHDALLRLRARCDDRARRQD